MHRELLGAEKGVYVDHVNLNTLDNRKSNLRKCTNSENGRNHKGQPKQRKHTTYKGVRKNTNCSTFSARIMVDKKSIYLGSFKTEIEAAIAYNKAAVEFHGEFAYLNDIKDVD